MKVRRFLLRAGLATLALGCLPAFALAQAANTAPQCSAGTTLGVWDLPQGGQLGDVGGVFANRAGEPVLRFGANLIPTPSPGFRGSKGVFVGKLLALTPRGPRPFAYVIGDWQARPNGQGRFSALIVRPGPTPLSPVRLLGRMAGRFNDPGPNRPGSYRGRWQICR